MMIQCGKKSLQMNALKGSKPMSEKVAAGKKKTALPAKVTLQRAPRGKNKSVTVIKGLATFGLRFLNDFFFFFFDIIRINR